MEENLLDLNFAKMVEKLTSLAEKIEIKAEILGEKKQPIREIKNEKITFDVGGEKIATTLATLTSKSGLFRALFSSQIEIKRDQDGCFFIDRDPSTFHILITYLRNQIIPEHLTEEELDQLKKDCKFFELHEFLDYLDNRSKVDGNVVYPKIIEDNKGRLIKGEEQVERILEKIQLSFPQEKVKLNVGGKYFHTTLKTLMRRESFFTGKCRSKFSIIHEEDGTYFIDRNPYTFHYILNFLRDDSKPKKLSEREHESLLCDIEFYGLSSQFNIDKLASESLSLIFGIGKWNNNFPGYERMSFADFEKYNEEFKKYHKENMGVLALESFIPDDSIIDECGFLAPFHYVDNQKQIVKGNHLVLYRNRDGSLVHELQCSFTFLYYPPKKNSPSLFIKR